MRRAVAVVGPTAAGKSTLASALVRELGGPVLVCDSVQVYRGLDIGSAKVGQGPAGAATEVEHALIDLVDPDVHFSAGDYAAAAWSAMEAGGRIFAGGTGFYLRAVAYTHSEDAAGPPVADPALRAAFEARWLAREEETSGAVHHALSRSDPATAAAIHPRNVLRALRALWLCELYGQPVSEVRRRDPPAPRLSLLLVEIDPGVEVVDRAIDERCDRMFAAGWIAEVEMLRARGYDARHRAMRSLGYKQILAHLEGEASLPDTVAAIKLATRRYARRQRTFFRHQFPQAARLRLSSSGAEATELALHRAEAFLAGDAP